MTAKDERMRSPIPTKPNPKFSLVVVASSARTIQGYKRTLIAKEFKSARKPLENTSQGRQASAGQKHKTHTQKHQTNAGMMKAPNNLVKEADAHNSVHPKRK
jgi:hypothetical protein